MVGMDHNPYVSPNSLADVSGEEQNADVKVALLPASGPAPEISPANTVVPRYLAFNFDLLGAGIASLMVGKLVGESSLILLLVVVVSVFLAYYFVFEALFAATPAKLAAGLVVVQFDGTRCTWRQAFIRTVFRIVEVNPFFFGALPAALSVAFSPYRQRLGDRVAETVVVLRRRLRRKH